jgi:3-phosphoshikimate 1-carboxyvinyltransferase
VSLRFEPASGPLRGTVRVPGDKSISHRAVLFAAMASGTSHLSGVLDSADVRSTIGAVSALGASVFHEATTAAGLTMSVTGWGDAGPTEPTGPIDCGNSGTTCRLIMGVLAGFPVTVTLDGDASLRRRPMGRVAVPLDLMGARIGTTDGRLPVTVTGGGLRGIAYVSPVASAQVKTAVLLAGLGAAGETSVSEPVLSRDHTELLLPAFGVPVACDVEAVTCAVTGPASVTATDIAVPADPSSAAFMVGAAAIVPGSEVVLPWVALNRTRLGFATVLRRMGADIRIAEGLSVGSEPVGTLTTRYRPGLTATTVAADEVPSLIDEIPLLAVVACSAHGTTRFEGVGELRVKETDRLASICEQLGRLGAVTRCGDDWLEVDGPVQVHGGTLDSLGDHRLAMSWAVASLVASGAVEIDDFDAVAVSYPRFAEDLAALQG